MFDTVLATVFADRNICWPIWAFVSPAARPSRISRSRWVSCGKGSAGGRGPAQKTKTSTKRQGHRLRRAQVFRQPEDKHNVDRRRG